MAEGHAAGEPSVERWRTRWTITDDFVADLGASLLVRHDRTSDDVTFALYDATTGARERELAWLPMVLPPSQRTYTDRFTFAGGWVSVVEGEPRTETTVRDLATGTIAWRRAMPSSIQLFDGDEGPFAVVIDRARSLMGVAAVATGAWRWSAPASAREVTLLGVTPAWVLTFESSEEDPALPGTLVARSVADGTVEWTERLPNPPYAPILVRSSAQWTVVAQGQSLSIRAARDGQRVTRAQLEQTIDSLAVTSEVVAVTADQTLVAYRSDTASVLWRREGSYDCVQALDDTFMAVASDAEWHELDAGTGALLFALRGGHCAWQFGAWSRGPGSLLLRSPSEIVAYEPSTAPLATETLRVHGVLTLDGVPIAGVHITLGTRETVTDAQGRFEFALRTRGRFALVVDESELGAHAPHRCLGRFDGDDFFEHEGTGGERTVDFDMRTYEPNPLTRCAQM